MNESTAIPFEWAVPSSSLDASRAALAQANARVDPAARPFVPPPEERDLYVDAAFEPLLILTGVAAAGALVDLVIGSVKRVKHSGILVDTRGGKLTIHEHPTLERGTVMVFSEQGAQEFDTRKQADYVGLLKGAILGK